MNTKSFEVLIHSQYAFDVCREKVYEFEDCKQTNTPVPRDPLLCRGQSKNLLECYKEAEKMDPICVPSFNDARECLFKGDGHLYNCRPYISEYVHCQNNPVNFKTFLEASDKHQKKSRLFDFVKYRGSYDKYMG